MRNVGLVITVLGLVAVFSGCLKTTNYKPLPAPAGESWGIERDRLSQSTMSGSSYQQRSAYDNKVYNVYVTKMSQAFGESYDAGNTHDAIKGLCPDPGKDKCTKARVSYRPLNRLPAQ